MSKNAKLIILILVVLLVVSAFMAASTMSQKAALEQSKAALEGELTQYKQKEKQLSEDNKKLNDQLKEAQNSQAKLQKQFSEVNDKLTLLTADRDEWKTKVDDLKRERDDLIAKLAEKPEPAPAPVAAPVVVSPGETAPPEEIVNVPPGEQDEKYWAEVLKAKAGLEIKLGAMQTKLSSGIVDTEELKKKVSDLELELGQLKNEKEEIDRKLKYSEELANTLSVELAREKNDKRYVGDRLEKIKEENLSLRAQVKELTTAKIALEKSMARLSGDKDNVEKKLATTESVIQNRIEEVLDIKRSLDKKLQTASPASSASQEIELPPIVVSAPAADSKGTSTTAPNRNGRIVSINADSNFVIIDLGENAGMRVGDTLSVFRGSKLIATVDVIQVRKDISAADIRQKGAKIQVGDAVR